MTRKDYLLENRNNKKYSKLLRPLRRDGKDLEPYAFMSMREKYAYNDIYKIGYLDIETSDLKADAGEMISYAVDVRDLENPKKNEIRYDFITQDDWKLAKKKREPDLIDERITENLLEDMSDIDLWIGHWFIGKHRHDVPFIRTRCAINSVSGFPKHKMIRYGDTQKWGSLIHRLRNNGLDTIGDAYKISIEKTHFKIKYWKLAAYYADSLSVKYIVDHNIKDVKLTHRIHKYMENYVPIAAIYA